MVAEAGATAGDNGIHHAQLCRTHMPGVGRAPFLAAKTEEVLDKANVNAMFR